MGLITYHWDIHHGTVLLGHCARGCRRCFCVAQRDCCVDPLSLGLLKDLASHFVLAHARIEYHVCPHFSRQRQTVISCVYTDHFHTFCFGELDPQMAESATRAHDSQPLAGLELRLQDRSPDCDTRACEWGSREKGHLVWDLACLSRVDNEILLKRPISLGAHHGTLL
jgi:hypothetical protein